MSISIAPLSKYDGFAPPLLSSVYRASSYLAAACLLAVFLTVVAQVVTRWFGYAFPGSTEFAGYFMAASTFFALAAALQNGVHIRITVIVSKLGSFQAVAEAVGGAIAGLIGCFVAYEACRIVHWSWALGDVSQGQDATPLWIPQLAMAVGSVIFAFALIENFVRCAGKLFTAKRRPRA